MGNAIHSTIEKFLNSHNFSLEVEGLEHLDSLQPIAAGSAKLGAVQEGKKIIVIDAGGTNFRSCLVEKKGSKTIISDFEKTSMPAVHEELSKHDFYYQIAKNILRLKDKADTIAFCFSYAIEFENGDAKILRFSKEVKAPQAVGTYVCQELKFELIAQGWAPSIKINVLNDTAALLLSGCMPGENKWGGQIAFILGTGMNSAYIEISQIVVTECGMFNDVVQSDVDKIVDKNSSCPGKSILEKMCSGAYIGEIAYQMLLLACKENQLSKQFAAELPNCAGMNAADFDAFFNQDKNEASSTSVLKKAANLGSENDRQIIHMLLQNLIERAAYICAQAIITAISHADLADDYSPICITCNGSTFWKTPLLKETVQFYLNKKLDRRFEIVQIEDDITTGSFVSAFIE